MIVVLYKILQTTYPELIINLHESTYAPQYHYIKMRDDIFGSITIRINPSLIATGEFNDSSKVYKHITTSDTPINDPDYFIELRSLIRQVFKIDRVISTLETKDAR